MRDKLYIQYSGGDDVFVVGAWDALPEFAAKLREAFGRFTGRNPAFTVSGGIAIVEAKFPLYQAAKLAGEAEDGAKSFRRADGREKDAIAFLDHTGDWGEFTVALADARRLAQWSEMKWAPKALLQVVIGLRE